MRKLKVFFLISFLLLLPSCTILNKTVRYSNVDNYHSLPTNGEFYDDSIKKIDLRWAKGDINIVSTKEYSSITLFEKTNGSFSTKYLTHVWHDNDYLRVRFCKSGVSFPNRYSKSLSLFIPENMLLDELEIDCEACNVTINDVNFFSININNMSGNYQIVDTFTERFVYQGKSGNLSYKIGHETKYIKVNQMSGNTILSLPKNALGFTMYYANTTGKLNSDYECEISQNKYIYQDPAYYVINFKAASGSLTLANYESEIEPIIGKNVEDTTEDVSIEPSSVTDESSKENKSVSETTSEESTGDEDSTEDISEQTSEKFPVDYSVEIVSDSGSWGPLN